jgi:hypothetical protein
MSVNCKITSTIFGQKNKSRLALLFYLVRMM